MKNWIIRMLLLIGYCIPYAFFAINGDISSGTMLFYGIMIISLTLLSYIATKTKNVVILIIGNILSYLSSYLFMLQNQTEEWGWYFKPLTANTLLLTISIIALLLQCVFAYVYHGRQRKCE